MARPTDGLVGLGRDTWVRAGLIVAVTGTCLAYGDAYTLPLHGARAEVAATVLLTTGATVAAYDDAATVVTRWRAALGEAHDG